MSWMVSTGILVLRRPFATFRQLGEDEGPAAWSLWMVRVARAQFILGAFVACITAGRLVPFHVVSTALFWLFFPVFQSLGVLFAHLLFARNAPRGHALALVAVGQAPFQFLLLTITAVTLFAPNPADLGGVLLRSFVLPAIVLLTISAGIFLTFAAFRSGLNLKRARALASTLTYYLVSWGGIAAYYFITNQIQPLMGWR